MVVARSEPTVQKHFGQEHHLDESRVGSTKEEKTRVSHHVNLEG